MTDALAKLSVIDDRWVTASEAAHYLGVSILTLSKWRLRGTGPRYSAALGRDPRYRLSDLAAFMDIKVVTNTIEAKTARRDSTMRRLDVSYMGAASQSGR